MSRELEAESPTRLVSGLGDCVREFGGSPRIRLPDGPARLTPNRMPALRGGVQLEEEAAAESELEVEWGLCWKLSICSNWTP